MTLNAFLSGLIWLCILPLLCLAVFLAYEHVDTLHKRLDQQGRDKAYNIAAIIDRRIEAQIAALQMLANSPLIDNPDRLSEFYKEALGFRDNFGADVILADLSTQMIFNTRVPFGQALPKLPVLRSRLAAPEVLATGKPAVSDMFIGPVVHKPLITMAVPLVRDSDMKFLLLCTIDTHQFQRILDKIASPAEWSVVVLDGKDEIIARRSPSDKEEILSQDNSSGRFVANSAVSHWSVVVQIPVGVYLMPTVSTAIAAALAILLMTFVSALAGRLAGLRLAQSVRALAKSPSPVAMKPLIQEVETVRNLLNDAFATRTKAEEILRRYELITANSRDIILLVDYHGGDIIEANSAACAKYGYTREELLNLTLYDLRTPDSSVFTEDQMAVAYADGILLETIHQRKDGSTFPVEVSSRGVIVGEKPTLVSIIRDITDRKLAEEEREKLQAQFHQAQKMESVGRLAGGVAHDFNNMLGVILGHTELAMQETGASQSLYADLVEIRTAANRSANLVRQLLVFARKQTIAPLVLDINETVENMLKMLRRLIGENIELSWRPCVDVWPVKMDLTQVDQVLANLCVNARDAILGVGNITLETSNASIDENFCRNIPDASPGEYVLLTVRDDGCGMGKETLGKLFEPFFTTKEVGKGTGLGLSTVYGIVKQNGGFVDVESAQGQGATFSLYLPRADIVDAQRQSVERPSQAPMGTETILLVEDEKSILAMAKKMLERHGYRVLAAGNPKEALDLARNNSGRVDLLITDVIMPTMNGKELAEKLSELVPGLKSLFMSGYTGEAITESGVVDEGVHFLQKPFSLKTLTDRVREVLSS